MGPTSATEPDVTLRVGRYVVLDEIGRGGMGRVLRAYDPKLRREVALKEVRSDALGPEATRRLVAEAHAMAKLSHPNVVALYDVEDSDPERFVIVMEYVPGQTLAEWLDQPRSWPEIVETFRAAGRGLAAAHAAQILHRDFKPENVLVGADGRVRVADFGLARDIVPEITHDARECDSPGNVTEAGRIVGTLAYLAPERLMGGPADTATDQFAFCVAMWEALFGERPFAGRSPVELAFTMSAGPPRPPPGARRIPPSLLDAVARGLAQHARQRWPSMDALLAALAYEPSRRRRRLLQAGAAFGLLAIAAIGVQAWARALEHRCTEAAAATHLHGAWDEDRRVQVRDAMLGVGVAYATDAWAHVETTLDAYASEWTQMHVEACEATNVRGMQSAAVMDLRMGCLHRAKVELAAVTKVLAQPEARTVQKAHELTGSLLPLERCADVVALQADVEPPLDDEAAAVESIRAQLAAATAAMKAARLDDARAALDEATAELSDVGYGPVHAEVARLEGELLNDSADYEGARETLHRALRLAAKWRLQRELRMAATALIYVVGYRLQRFEEAMRYADLASALTEDDPLQEAEVRSHIAIVLDTHGKFAEAEAEQRRVLALREQTQGPDHADVAQTRSNLATVLVKLGKAEEAEAEHRRALVVLEQVLGPHHPRIATALNNLGAALHAQGRADEAEPEWRRALAIREAALGPDHPDVAQSHNNLGALFMGTRDFAAALAEYRKALAIREKVLGPDHPDVAGTRHNIGAALRYLGRLEEAEAELRAALAVYDERMPESRQAALQHHNLAAVLSARHEYEEAVTEYRRALALRERLLGTEHEEIAESLHNLGNALLMLGRYEEAEALHRRALAMWEKTLGLDHPYIPMSQTNLVRVLLERGAIEESRRLAEAAWNRSQRDDIAVAQRAATGFVLARALWEGGDRSERERAIESAERALEDSIASADGETDAVRAWLEARRP